MADNRQTGGVVWILGAGFSRPLGGPLLDDLISTHVLESMSEDARRKYDSIWTVYAVGTRSGSRTSSKWSDPEVAKKV